MMIQIKNNLKGLVKGDLFITLNQKDNLVIISADVKLSNLEKQYCVKQVKKVNSSLQVFFR